MSAPTTRDATTNAFVMVYLRPDVKRRFQQLCVANGQTMTGVLAAFVEDLVSRHSPARDSEGR